MTYPNIPADYVQTCVLAGVNLDGGAGVTGFELHADTKTSRSVQWRKQTVENNWVEGSYDVSAVRGNVTESLVVWVYGRDHNEFEQRVSWLTDQIAQAAFTITWTRDGMTEVWDCTYSDYIVETQREFQWARQGVVRLSIVRRPRVTRTYADTTTYAG